MKVKILTRKKFFDCDEYYTEIDEIELESFRWNKNHQFEFVAKNSNRWRTLEQNQEIMGLGV